MALKAKTWFRLVFAVFCLTVAVEAQSQRAEATEAAPPGVSFYESCQALTEVEEAKVCREGKAFSR